MDGGGASYLSPRMDFLTLDEFDFEPPIITGVTLSNLTPTSATISWTTNEPSDSEVEFWYFEGSTKITPTLFTNSLVTSHSMNLSDLIPDTEYRLNVRSRDGVGNVGVSGVWLFDTPPTVTSPAEMQTPTPGTTITTSDVTFNWSVGSGVTNYALSLGTSVGATDIFDQETTGTSLNVSGIPLDGNTLYVRLWSFIGSGWQFIDYTYQTQAPTSSLAELILPTSGTVIANHL